MLDERDKSFLERAYALAENGRGLTSPNPLVGAVIVKDGVVAGEGWHVSPGRDHAEIAAIKDALVRIGRDPGPGAWERSAAEVCNGATMYVTLEPCCTQGRTPPCTNALIAAGFGRVVVGAIDPSPQVDGNGLQILREAGVSVDLAEGLLARHMKRQNDGLRKAVAKGLPFVTYKYAMTLDGRVATDAGDSRWVSNRESRLLVHRWRAWSDAVAVGAGTVAEDDPLLTAREVDCARQPLRVVIDSRLRLGRKSRVVESVGEAPVLVVCADSVEVHRREEVTAWGVEVAAVGSGPDGEVDPWEACRALAKRDVQTVLLEGGPHVAAAWWNAGMIDKIAAFVCPKIVSGLSPRSPLVGTGVDVLAQAEELVEVEVERIASDVLITAYKGGPY